MVYLSQHQRLGWHLCKMGIMPAWAWQGAVRIRCTHSHESLAVVPTLGVSSRGAVCRLWSCPQVGVHSQWFESICGKLCVDSRRNKLAGAALSFWRPTTCLHAGDLTLPQWKPGSGIMWGLLSPPHHMPGPTLWVSQLGNLRAVSCFLLASVFETPWLPKKVQIPRQLGSSL